VEEVRKGTRKDMEKATKVNLASGRMYMKGYLNVDNLSMNPGQKVDKKADVLKVSFKASQFNEVLVCHFLMYVTPSEARKLFKRCYKWLKPKGELIIETSDALRIAEMILSDPERVDQMFGYGATAGHKWSWTAKTLKPLLKEAGFKRVVVSKGGLHNRPDRDITLICTK